MVQLLNDISFFVIGADFKRSVAISKANTAQTRSRQRLCVKLKSPSNLAESPAAFVFARHAAMIWLATIYDLTDN